ncbi:putative colanic acid biosysnthesis UDP-glucose lipid carrier transferase [Pseudoxanthomonas sp. GM95]|uniref:undecaprenyl-phosphate glucose phosphotransferase n=1 Tax=Pseudoxanthomonas sp. GM95 TaxID=1881043 RepID=UPI0008C936F0|nr:undecaprenyl-phosphate glucose phosphotransferase [Pseudoxanthomonas sp. GM95]SEM45175.1 putative colanic acid biosysnthesis UDP-glucose lipid carrier transferase [Pseudoxanthomonas sp. GM95]
MFEFLLRLADLVCLSVGGVIAYRWQFGSFDLDQPFYWPAILCSLLFGMILLNGSTLYHQWRGRALRNDVARVVILWVVMFIGMALYRFALGQLDDLAFGWWCTWFVLSLGTACTTRVWVRHTGTWLRAKGVDRTTAVIVGGGRDAERLVRALSRERWAGIDILGWFDSPGGYRYLEDVPKLGDVEALVEYVDAHQIDQVWIALPMTAQAEITSVLNQLRHSTADIKCIPDFFDVRMLNHSVEKVAGLAVINLQQSPHQGAARLLKDVEDRVLSGAILLMISPLMLMIAAAVKLSSPGPVFYRQERVSWNGRSFKMLKFRSMPVDAESSTGAVWARSGESRATAVGAFLRKTSLDELPQFINVLKGDMSIVGPRPERPMFVEKFREEIPAYMQKHMVKAGITGWAQINGWRGSTDLQRRIECDLYYIENWSLALDIRIIFLTLFKGFVHRNAY